MSSRRRPILAGLLSFLVPGLGQLYSGQARRAATLLALYYLAVGVGIILALSLPVTPLSILALLAPPLGAFVYVVVDAVRVARFAPEPYVLRWYNRWYVYAGLIALFAFVIAPLTEGFIKGHALQAFRIPTSGMEPSLLIGDYLLVSMFPLGKRDVARGSVIVFTSPDGNYKFFRRVAGRPADTLEMRDGVLYVNGRRQEDPFVHRLNPDGDYYVEDFDWQEPYLVPSARREPYRPTRDNWGPILVAPGHYFVLGDNRNYSHDSRYFGFVPEGNVLGKAHVIYFSYDSGASTVRWGRIGEAPWR